MFWSPIFPKIFGIAAPLHVYRFSIGTKGLPYSPTYFDDGRRRTASSYCSITWAVHPAILLEAKKGVKYSLETPRVLKTTAA